MAGPIKAGKQPVDLHRSGFDLEGEGVMALTITFAADIEPQVSDLSF